MDLKEPLRQRKKGMLYRKKNLYIGTKKLTADHRVCGRKLVCWESHPNSGKFNARCMVHPNSDPGILTGDFPWLPTCTACLVELIDEITNAVHTDRVKKGAVCENRLPLHIS
jgi:hypothetical protein